MNETNRIEAAFNAPFHAASCRGSPDDVVCDELLSAAEKRVILSSWASDMYAVESNPALREVPGIPHALRLDDILAALRRLDWEDDPPPRGGMAMRTWRPRSVDAVAQPPTASRQHHAWRRSWVATRGRC